MVLSYGAAVLIVAGATGCSTARLSTSPGSTDVPSASAPSSGPKGGVRATSPTGVAATARSTVDATNGANTPAPLMPAVLPARQGEGTFSAVADVGGVPVVWTTRVRPIAGDPTVEASVAVVDPTKLKAALFNGPVVPGGGPWKNSDHVSAAAVPALVAAFNGGFEFPDFTGGYMTEGRVVRRLTNDQATLGIRADGSIAIGVFGRGMSADGTWVSLRQNLPPLVLAGKVAIDQFPGTRWGGNYHGVTVTNRSAICTRADGRLMYLMIGPLQIRPFAAALASLGCQTAMELDINGTWPQFATYTNPGTQHRAGTPIDPRMSNPNRYLTSSKKDFVALFDPSTLPSGAVF
jgi:hypothetical protein